jgi:Rieske Fe-S protein
VKGENMLGVTLDTGRRAFCNGVVLTAVSVGFTSAVRSQEPKSRARTLSFPPQKINGAEQLMPGSFLYFNYPTSNHPAVLFRTNDGEFKAYSRKCAHLGCSVDFDMKRSCLRCPCHQGVYEATTGFVIYGPPPRPLDQIVLQMRAGNEVWAVGRTVGDTDPNA